jgi:hypothetical protein
MKNMSKLVLVAFALLLTVAAFAKNKRYEVQFGQNVQAAGTELKAGTYQVEMDGNSLTFYQGKKEVAKVPVRTEETQKKVEATTVTVSSNQLKTIELGGTKTRLILEGQ